MHSETIEQARLMRQMADDILADIEPREEGQLRARVEMLEIALGRILQAIHPWRYVPTADPEADSWIDGPADIPSTVFLQRVVASAMRQQYDRDQPCIPLIARDIARIASEALNSTG